MAVEQPGYKIGFIRASASLAGKQYFAVDLEVGTDGWALAGAGEHHMIGVLQNVPTAAGEAAEVVCEGVTKAVAGAAISKYARLTVNASGKFITATDATHVVGIALEAAGADGDIITMYLKYAGEFEITSPA